MMKKDQKLFKWINKNMSEISVTDKYNLTLILSLSFLEANKMGTVLIMYLTV